MKRHKPLDGIKIVFVSGSKVSYSQIERCFRVLQVNKSAVFMLGTVVALGSLGDGFTEEHSQRTTATQVLKRIIKDEMY